MALGEGLTQPSMRPGLSTPRALVLLPSQSDGRRDPQVIVHGHGAPPDDREPVGHRWFTPTSVRFDVATIRTRRGVGCRSGRARHRAATTFYSCRLAADHLIVHAPFGAGDTRYEHAPSTKSVRCSRPDWVTGVLDRRKRDERVVTWPPERHTLKPTAATRWRNDPDGMRRSRSTGVTARRSGNADL